MLAATLYVVLLILSHAQLPPIHVWVIAMVFSVAMNFTYLTEAYSVRRFLRLEVLVASTLIVASILGVLVSPLFVIGAILSHGVWDMAKHCGIGIPFFRWYTLSCAAVDTLYGLTLLLYWQQSS